MGDRDAVTGPQAEAPSFDPAGEALSGRHARHVDELALDERVGGYHGDRDECLFGDLKLFDFPTGLDPHVCEISSFRSVNVITLTPPGPTCSAT